MAAILLETVCDDAHACTMAVQLNQLRLENVLTGVKLVTGDDVISCHKVVLAVGCQYFHTMFTSGFNETSSDRVEIINIEHSVLQTVVDYLYTGEINITPEDVQSLVQTSDMLGLPKVKEASENFMMNHILSSDNCIGLFNFSGVYQLQHLKDKSHDFMLLNFKNISLGKEFKDMTETQLANYIMDPGLNIPNESYVFDAIVLWVNHHVELRKHCFMNLVQKIPLHRCPLSYLQDVVMKEPLMKLPKCEECLVKVLGNLPRVPTFDNVSPREGFVTERRLIVGGGVDIGSSINAQFWTSGDTDKNIFWDPCHPLPNLGGLQLYSVCQTDKQLIITGGDGQSNQACCFNTMTKTWDTLPDMHIARFRHMSISVSNALYVFGGEDSDAQPLTSVEQLDLVSRNWSIKAMLPKPLYHSAVAQYAGDIYLFGGMSTADDHLRNTFAYSICLNNWKELVSMPEACTFGTAVTVGETIYYLGGFSKTCMSFKPRTNQWSYLSRPLSRHADCAAIAWKHNCILLSGGRRSDTDDAQNGTDVIEEYNIGTNSWKMYQNKLPKILTLHFMAYMDVWIDSHSMNRH